MIEVLFKVKATGEPLQFSKAEHPSVTKSREAAMHWGEANGFTRLTFWLEEGQASNHLLVQFDDEAPLSTWVDLLAIREGRTEDLENQLDFARGEYRRRLSGFDKYDR